MTATRNLSTVVLAVCLVAAVGCGRPFNDQIDLVGVTALPALTDAAGQSTLDAKPSVTQGLDRQSWSTVAVQVPRDQVGHYPTYAINFRWQKERGPWNPAYPAATEAVTDTPDAGQDLADGVTEPVVAAGMLVWAPIDMIFFNQVWVEHRSPSEPYALVPGRPHAHLVKWFDAPNKSRALHRDSAPTDTPDDPADGGQPHP